MFRKQEKRIFIVGIRGNGKQIPDWQTMVKDYSKKPQR